jgi:hypothetical protein
MDAAESSNPFVRIEVVGAFGDAGNLDVCVRCRRLILDGWKSSSRAAASALLALLHVGCS